MSGKNFTVEIQASIPPGLARLRDLAGDLYFSWDRQTRRLFYYLDPALWQECRHNPKVFLRRVAQQRLEEILGDRVFMEEYERTLTAYDAYLRAGTAEAGGVALAGGLVAYFCAEFGLHESLPVYSGGLGILAGDLCKAASDMALPFAAVGLFYRGGNLLQTIDDHGQQQVEHVHVDPDDLPILPARGPDGGDVIVTVELPESRVQVRVWHARVGHSNLYLLDADVASNRVNDRGLTQVLYPADKELRLRQEMILGIGGVRALRALGLNPAVWHVNEGHPSLLLLERCRELVRGGMDFHAAHEAVAASSVFTTHTPVTAGHEVYDRGLILSCLSPLLRELGLSDDEFMALGMNTNPGSFNLTTFALRSTRFHNGVSRIHRDVAASLERHIWPELASEDIPFGHVTNGVHVPTFLSLAWLDMLGPSDWHRDPLYTGFLKRIDAIPDEAFWSMRKSLKAVLRNECRRLVELRCRRHGHSQPQIDSLTGLLDRDEDVMVISFARRFATYKRATLLFDDPDRLQRLLSDPKRPVLLIFAGRAHPNDEPGKELIRRIHDFTMQTRFQGRILLLEGYDLALARVLVAGSDVWVNTPEYPMEASGTSGMKAAINGTINLSILDGWWAEGYTGTNGWGLQPHAAEPGADSRRRAEARELMDTLEFQVLPLYFDNAAGYSKGWVKMARESMRSVIAGFSAHRMLRDYAELLYMHSRQSAGRLMAENAAGAARLAQWKQEVRARWHGVSLRRVDEALRAMAYGKPLEVAVAVKLNGLRAEDVAVECQIGKQGPHGEFAAMSSHLLSPGATQGTETTYGGAFELGLSGLVSYRLRAYPRHPLLSQAFEMGFMKWI